MTIDHLLYVVLVSQLVVISLYVPSRVLRRARALVASYPPSEFPKLYPVPVATIEKTLRIYRNLNLGFVALGLALLAAGGYYGYTIDPAWRGGDVEFPNPIPAITVFTLLQMLPTGLLSFFELGYFKRMRTVSRDRIRTAELKARRVFDFVSPALLVTAVAMYVGVAVASLLFLGAPRGMGIMIAGAKIGPGAIMIACLTLTNLVMAGCLIWLLYGKKLDPHQTHEDRARTIRSLLHSGVVASILVSAFYGAVIALIEIRLLYYMPFALSLFCQVFVVVLTGKFCMVIPFGQQSYEGYRADPSRRTG